MINLQVRLMLAHAFGQRYELPIPLALFMVGGAGVVLLSFWLVLQRKAAVGAGETGGEVEQLWLEPLRWGWLAASLVAFILFVAAGLAGSQEIPENIVPTVFWLVVWIAVPLSCGLLGDWTQRLNGFAGVAKLTDCTRLRRMVLGRREALRWPVWLGWWPAAGLYFALACGELIYNQVATRPAVIAGGLLAYFLASGLMGLLFGRSWLARGEVFTVLFSTWGRLGFWRFGAAGQRGFAGGLKTPFEAVPSRVVFVLLLLTSVSFDGLLATPLWSRLQLWLPASIGSGTVALKLLTTLVFVALAVVIWAVFMGFALAVARAGGHKVRPTAALAGLLPSLLPISFGYLLAHNLEYLVVNGQLLFPLIGNPVGTDGWPIHLPYPFNDSFEPNIHVLPGAFYWYAAVAVIVAVHVVAVVLAHRYLSGATRDESRARRSEYPWVAAMVAYTMLSLWLLAQPLVKEKPGGAGYVGPRVQVMMAVDRR